MIFRDMKMVCSKTSRESHGQSAHVPMGCHDRRFDKKLSHSQSWLVDCLNHTRTLAKGGLTWKKATCFFDFFGKPWLIWNIISHSIPDPDSIRRRNELVVESVSPWTALDSWNRFQAVCRAGSPSFVDDSEPPLTRRVKATMFLFVLAEGMCLFVSFFFRNPQCWVSNRWFPGNAPFNGLVFHREWPTSESHCSGTRCYRAWAK